MKNAQKVLTRGTVSLIVSMLKFNHIPVRRFSSTLIPLSLSFEASFPHPMSFHLSSFELFISLAVDFFVHFMFVQASLSGHI